MFFLPASPVMSAVAHTNPNDPVAKTTSPRPDERKKKEKEGLVAARRDEFFFGGDRTLDF